MVLMAFWVTKVLLMQGASLAFDRGTFTGSSFPGSSLSTGEPSFQGTHNMATLHAQASQCQYLHAPYHGFICTLSCCASGKPACLHACQISAQLPAVEQISLLASAECERSRAADLRRSLSKSLRILHFSDATIHQMSVSIARLS